MLHANVFVAQYQHHLALNHHRNQRHDLHHIFFSHPRRPALWALLHLHHQQPQIKPQIYSYSDPHPILIRKALSASRVHLLLGSSITHTLWWLTQFSSARLPFCHCLCHHQTFNFPLISFSEVAPCFDLINWSWQARCIERGGSDWCPAPQRIFGWKLIQRKGTSVRKARSHNQIGAFSAWDVSTVHNLVAIMVATKPNVTKAGRPHPRYVKLAAFQFCLIKLEKRCFSLFHKKRSPLPSPDHAPPFTCLGHKWSTLCPSSSTDGRS